MTRRNQRERDPLWRQEALARLARMRMLRAIRETEEVEREWDERRDNVLEAVYLRRLRTEGGAKVRDADG